MFGAILGSIVPSFTWGKPLLANVSYNDDKYEFICFSCALSPNIVYTIYGSLPVS